MDLTLDIARPDDAPDIARLVNSAYRGDSSRRGWTTEADLLDGQRTDEEALRAEIADPRNALLLFRAEGRLVASVLLQNRGDRAYLGMFTVDPDRQALGIGKAALIRIEAWVRASWGVGRIEMTVISLRRELIAWYARRGYVDTGRREPFPYGDPRVGLPKVADLAMVVLEKAL